MQEGINSYKLIGRRKQVAHFPFWSYIPTTLLLI